MRRRTYDALDAGVNQPRTGAALPRAQRRRHGWSLGAACLALIAGQSSVGCRSPSNEERSELAPGRTMLAPSAAPEPPAANRPLGIQFADSVLSRWPQAADIAPSKGWEYTIGIVLYGLQKVYERTRRREYLNYIQSWVDSHLKRGIDWGSEHNLDRIQPATLLLLLYRETKDERYQRAASDVRQRYDAFPKNEHGGFWHKDRYPNEMWLDGVYMASPFLASYAKLFSCGEYCFYTATQQSLLVYEKTRTAGATLLRHGWDADKNAAWADADSGVAPMSWARGSAWYLMALVEILEQLPADHDSRARLLEVLAQQANAIAEVQDSDTGLWSQVLDQPKAEGNWHETSASAMFVYALGKGVKLELLDAKFQAIAERGWRGVKSKVRRGPRGPVLTDSVEGMGIQADYQSYIGKRRVDNSPHGLCGVLLASSVMEL